MRPSELSFGLRPLAFFTGLYAVHAALMFISLPSLFEPLRVFTAILLIFVTPGYFIVDLLFGKRDLKAEEVLIIILVTSVLANIVWAIGMNYVLRVPISDAAMYFLNLSLVIMLALMDFIKRKMVDKTI